MTNIPTSIPASSSKEESEKKIEDFGKPIQNPLRGLPISSISAAHGDDSKSSIVYSETFEPIDLETENKVLQDELNKLEQENRVAYLGLKQAQDDATLLKEMFAKASGELENLKKPSLLVGEVGTIFPKNKAIVKLPNGNKFYSYVSVEIKDLKHGDMVLVDQKSLNIIEKIEVCDEMDVEKFVIVNKPKESWNEIGGLDAEIQEVKEVIELPLKKPELFQKVGIKPPKGVLLYGPPGTGKTLLAKAVANSTQATFIEVVGSELVQKFIGEGARLVKEMFNLAKAKAPSIIFIDEIDALASVRMENGTSGEREVNRTFMQLLSELDGFNNLDNVKVIGATNRIDILDQAIIRPGRLDRLIEVGLPDDKGRMEILKVHSKEMNLQKVKLKEISEAMADFSGAEIRATCTEAGYFAIRENRDHVTHDDFLKAIEKVRFEEEEDLQKGFYG